VQFQLFRLLAILGPLVGGLWGLHLAIFDAPTSPPLSLFAVRGSVEQRKHGGAWQEVGQGTRLGAGDAVRVGRDGSATLAIPGGSSALLGPGAEIALDQVGATLQEITLRRGTLEVRVAPDPRHLVRVTVPPAHASVESIGGTFSVRSDEQGAMILKNLAGEVRWTHGGRSRRLRPGEEFRHGSRDVRRLVAEARRPADIPSTVILKASWPKQTALRGAAGSKAPGRTEVRAVIGIRGVRLEPPAPVVARTAVSPPPVAEAPPSPRASPKKQRPKKPRRLEAKRPAPPPAKPAPAPATPEKLKVHVPSWD
jgi:hypothetical protein